MHYWIYGTVIVSGLLSGCSLWTSQDTPENTVVQPRAPLVIPAGLKAPKAPAQFDVPKNVASGVQGSAVELKAPMQILAISTNAMVEEDEKEVRVFFERNEYTGDLLPFLQQQLQQFLTTEPIGIAQNNQLQWQTNWVDSYRESGWWLWESQTLTQQSRFAIELQPKPHGRTVAVKVNLLEHKSFESDTALSPIAQRREEVHFLNRFIDHVATVELALISAAKAKLPDVTLTRGIDAENNAVLVTAQPIDVAWNQLETLFERLSLDVTDLNRTDYTFYLNFKKPEVGFWSSIWGEEPDPVLPLTEGDYQLVLTKTDQGTALKWRDKDGAALDQATVDAIYEVFLAVIRKDKIDL